MKNIKFIFLIIIIGFISASIGVYFNKNLSPIISDSETKIFFNSESKNLNNESIQHSQYKNKWLFI